MREDTLLKSFYALLLIVMTCCISLPASASGPVSLPPQEVAKLKAARGANQLILVGNTVNTDAVLTFYEKRGTSWKKVFTTHAYIGKKGLGKSKENDGKTPVGVFRFTKAFGLAPDPGCALGYTQVNESHYWVGDSQSPFYNKLVSTRNGVKFDKSKSEHIAEYFMAYQYVLNIGYNEGGKPGLGSAIFLHCATGIPFTGGGVAIPEEYMLRLMQTIQPRCKIVIAKLQDLSKF
ncbi:MAG: L,D-transpeptidase family protein [Desulfovibrio sp.]|nr:L,D-transpeptidase family protein [Desulfovibrio sp.]